MADCGGGDAGADEGRSAGAGGAAGAAALVGKRAGAEGEDLGPQDVLVQQMQSARTRATSVAEVNHLKRDLVEHAW